MIGGAWARTAAARALAVATPWRALGRAWRIALPAAGAFIFVLIIVGGYVWDWKWTGFHGTTLWDWLQLLVLPVVVAVGGLWFTMRQHCISRALAQQQDENSARIADDNQQEAALQAYLNHLSQLLLDKQLKESPPGSSIRELAQARTLTTVWHVGRSRKGIVLRFLHQANLIARNNAVVELEGADLSHAQLGGIDLRAADLRGANLRQADLRGARLDGVHLGGANLGGADLRGAALNGADLSRADLAGADLSGADLTGSDLTGAKLDGAILDGAKLDGAKLDRFRLRGAPMADTEVMIPAMGRGGLGGAAALDATQP
jgi:uncharacterized protein YjbI with pentapeptide repeats